MAEILIGNIKGPQGAKGDKGDKGDTGPQGPAGPQGATGPMPALVNGFTTTEAGIAALDAAAGKTLKDEVTQLNSDMAWKNAGNVNDKSPLSLPSSYNEICISAYLNGSVVFFSTLPRSIIQDNATTYATSGRVGNNVLSIRLSLSKASVQIADCYINDIESSESAAIGLSVYYR